jgi:hypothetical protein
VVSRLSRAACSLVAWLLMKAESISLLTMSAGLGTSVIAGHSSAGQAQAVIEYHLRRLFPAPPRA